MLDLRSHLNARTPNEGLNLARRDLEYCRELVAKSSRDMRTLLETANNRAATMKRLRVAVNENQTSTETSSSDTQGEPEDDIPSEEEEVELTIVDDNRSDDDDAELTIVDDNRSDEEEYQRNRTAANGPFAPGQISGSSEQEVEAQGQEPVGDSTAARKSDLDLYTSSEEEEGEHDWNKGKERPEYDIYEGMEQGNSPAAPQEEGQLTITWRPVTLPTADRSQLITPQQSGLLEHNINSYLHERDQPSDRTFRAAILSPSTSRAVVDRPVERQLIIHGIPPESTSENAQKSGWQVRNDGSWYNTVTGHGVSDSDFEADEIDGEELGHEDDPSGEEATKKATRQDHAK